MTLEGDGRPAVGIEPLPGHGIADEREPGGVGVSDRHLQVVDLEGDVRLEVCVERRLSSWLRYR